MRSDLEISFIACCVLSITWLSLSLLDTIQRRRFCARVIAALDGADWLAVEAKLLLAHTWRRLRAKDSYQTEEWFCTEAVALLREFVRGYRQRSAELREALKA